jgi:uncharacterized protein YggE
MDSTNEIRELVLRNASTDAIRDSARRDGMRTLAEDGRRLIEDGATTIEEVLSVTTIHEFDAKPAPADAEAEEKASPKPGLKHGK